MESKHTKGNISRGLYKDKLIQLDADNPIKAKTICGVWGNDETSDADADLIVNAFNTTNSCGLLPSELLKQRDELLEALNYAIGIMGYAEYMEGVYTAEDDRRIIELIKSCTK